MPVRIVAGEISATDATTRLLIPTPKQGKWPPFVRVAETLATPRRRFPAHSHSGVEVLTYVVEGSGTYELQSRPAEPVAAGSVHLLTAPTAVGHAINPGKGQTLRWFGVVVTLTDAPPNETRDRSSPAGEPGAGPDSFSLRSLVGPGSVIPSAAGMEVASLHFVSEATTFRPMGHNSLAVCYALAGRGRIDSEGLEGGEAALIDESAGIAVHGESGFRAVVVRVPRPT